MVQESPDRIRELIRKKGLTQAEFAAKLGISQQQVSNLLSGKRAWTQKTWEATAKALGITPMELYGETVSKDSDTVPVLLVFEKLDYERLSEEARRMMVDVPSLLKFAAAEFLEKKREK
jgi:transcriptional regulator with XRE-family HTH domain